MTSRSFHARRARLAAIAAFASFLAPRAARATARPLPFTYTTDTLAEGAIELEQYADVTPVRAQSSSTGAPVWYGATQFQTEIEYGITNRLELGLYFVYVPSPGDGYTSTAPMTEGTGVKQRLRYVFADPGAWPVDVGLYGELVENDHEVELEAKVLLQRRFGNLRVDANLWAEYEVYYAPQKDLVLDPTLGATYQITPTVHVGAEGWARVEYPDPAPHPRPYSVGPAGYVGPTLLLDFGHLWWSTGLYGRVTETAHTMQPGEPYGPVWARTVVGIEL
jgi:hypothetical protein